MRARRFAAALTVCVCVLFGLFTLTKSGVFDKAVAQNPGPISPISESFDSHEWSAAPTAPAAAAKRSIIAQLKAFKIDDYQTAMVYQSSVLKVNFATPGDFRKMMVRDYPLFTRVKRVVFGPVLSTADQMVVQIPVKLTDTDGAVAEALYLMVLEKGLYRVASVEDEVLPPTSVAPIDPKFT